MQEIIKTPIDGLKILKPLIHKDSRGFFFESFNQKIFNSTLGNTIKFVQDNHSFSKKNVLRGLHLQIKKPQGKLVSVLNGSIFDVAIDLRKNSKTFAHWHGCILSRKNKNQLWIPPGFAHGFLSLRNNTEVLYKTTDYWDKNDEYTILWNDKTININWPKVEDLIISEKDKQGETLKKLINIL